MKIKKCDFTGMMDVLVVWFGRDPFRDNELVARSYVIATMESFVRESRELTVCILNSPFMEVDEKIPYAVIVDFHVIKTLYKAILFVQYLHIKKN